MEPEVNLSGRGDRAGEEDNVAHHALKHHLRYRVFYCEWDPVLQNEHRAASKKTLTNNWDHKPIGKQLREVNSYRRLTE